MQAPPAPPSGAPTGFTFRKQSSSFSIRAKSAKQVPAEPALVEDWIVAYDMPREELREHLAKIVFPGYSFEGEKIRLKGDNLMIKVPRMLTEDEKTEIYKMKKPGAS